MKKIPDTNIGNGVITKVIEREHRRLHHVNSYSLHHLYITIITISWNIYFRLSRLARSNDKFLIAK